MVPRAERGPDDQWPSWAGHILQAWNDLQHDRPSTVQGVGNPEGGFILRSVPGPLPWSAIDRWAHRHAMIGDDFTLLHAMLRELDREYLDHLAAQSSQ